VTFLGFGATTTSTNTTMDFGVANIEIQNVPEPPILMLLAFGAVCLVGSGLRYKKVFLS
jgi:hypothetical protein